MTVPTAERLRVAAVPRARRLLHDSLLVSAAAAPDKTAVIASAEKLSYRELLDRALRLARALQERGVRRGDRVAIFLENDPWVVAGVYGALLAGAAFLVVNAQTKEDKLRYILADSGAAALLTGTQLAPVAARAMQRQARGREGGAAGGDDGLPALRTVLLAGKGAETAADTVPRGAALEEALAAVEPAPLPADTIPLDLAALVYTSGSTGNPKGVMLSHLNMTFAQQSLVEYLRLAADDRILNVLPLAFDYGLYQALMAVHLGATLVLERSFAFPAQVVTRIRDERVTVLPGVPTVFATLLAMHRRQPLALPTVRRITNTAAHLPDTYVPPLREMCPDALIYKMYGLTECKRVCYLEPELVLARPMSVGKAIPGTETFVLDERGEPVPAGVTGVLHVRGPHVMMGYWHLPEETARMLVPGRYPGERMLCTHDLFKVDADGFLYFVGRSDDIIKSGAEKVSPVEVENALSTIPGVREVAVAGVPDELLGQAIRAYVVLDPGVSMDGAEFRRRSLERLEALMAPRDVVFLDELPKTGTGKVRRKDLGALEGRPA
jgi:long-chain acyl-CoA synthetase